MWGWIGPTQLVNQSLTGLNFHSGQFLNPFESRLDGRSLVFGRGEAKPQEFFEYVPCTCQVAFKEDSEETNSYILRHFDTLWCKAFPPLDSSFFVSAARPIFSEARWLSECGLKASLQSAARKSWEKRNLPASLGAGALNGHQLYPLLTVPGAFFSIYLVTPWVMKPWPFVWRPWCRLINYKALATTQGGGCWWPCCCCCCSATSVLRPAAQAFSPAGCSLSPPRRRLNVNLNLSCCAGGAQCVRPRPSNKQPEGGSRLALWLSPALFTVNVRVSPTGTHRPTTRHIPVTNANTNTNAKTNTNTKTNENTNYHWQLALECHISAPTDRQLKRHTSSKHFHSCIWENP